MRFLRNIFSNIALTENPLLVLIDFLQIVLLFIVLYTFKIEHDSGLSRIALVVMGAYILMHLVNKEFIPWVFVMAGVAVVIFAFGLFSGGILLGVCALLFLSLSPRYNIYVKISVFLILLGALGFFRVGFVYVPRVYLVMPFIGALFMFRGFMYLYYEKNHKLRGSLKHRVAYFFMFPNLVFLLYPIVDFKEFVTTFLIRPFSETRQKGIRYMLRAIVHLLLYRLIYTYLYIDNTMVHDLPSLLYFMVTGYLLILRLSGILHMSMGLICLFGYDLSPVFNFFFLGASFTDLWRRINTYWRNFMQKVFFYPFYFRIRKPLGNWALPIATAVMFVFTWFFHNYQFFWLRGQMTFSMTDALFWLILGSCITLNVVYLDNKARTRKNKVVTLTRKYALQSFFILFCFMFMSFLWSLWGAADMDSWKNTLSGANNFTTTQLLSVIGIFTGVYFLIFGLHFVYEKPAIKNLILLDAAKTRFLTIPSLALLAAFPLLVKQMNMQNHQFCKVMMDPELSAADISKKERGYYKQLIDGNQPGAGSWEVTLMRPLPPNVGLAAESTTDIFLRRLKPSASIEWNEKPFTTNKFAIRDSEYPLVKGANDYRIAILGGSYEMGTGVGDDEVFEQVAEKKLKPPKDSGIEKIEMMNFSVGGYHVMQQVKMMEEQVLRVKPDMVILFAHSRDQERLSGFYSDLIEYGMNLEYDYLKKIKKATGVKQSMSEDAIKKAVMPYTDSIIMWAYKRIADDCKRNKIKPVWIYLPATNDSLYQKERNWARKVAKDCGYETFDLSSVYDDANIPLKKRVKIQVSKDDPHPNARGHRIIAKGLVKLLTENSYIFNDK
jgi:hypothetical protein